MQRRSLQFENSKYGLLQACRDTHPGLWNTDAVCSNQRSYQASGEQATYKSFGKEGLDEVMNIWNSYIGSTE